MYREITQRELRNASAEIIDAVESGETLVITRNGHAVGELRPIHRRRMVPIGEVLQNFADCPRMDYGRLRADVDALFGEDRVLRPNQPRYVFSTHRSSLILII